MQSRALCMLGQHSTSQANSQTQMVPFYPQQTIVCRIQSPLYCFPQSRQSAAPILSSSCPVNWAWDPHQATENVSHDKGTGKTMLPGSPVDLWTSASNTDVRRHGNVGLSSKDRDLDSDATGVLGWTQNWVAVTECSQCMCVWMSASVQGGRKACGFLFHHLPCFLQILTEPGAVP